MPKPYIDKSLLTYNLAQTEDEKIYFANLALKNRLYVSGWCLSGQLLNIRISDNSLDYEVCMAFYDGLPVGIHIVNNNNFGSFFVKKIYRKNGIGTKMFEIMKTKKNKIKVDLGVDGSYKFFNRLGLRII